MNFSKKQKRAVLNSIVNRKALLVFFLFNFWTLFFINTFAQEPPPTDSLRVIQMPDSLVADTLATDSTAMAADSLQAANQSDIETTITYYARDSINFSMTGKIVKLYGNAKITYGSIELEAEEIKINYNTNEVEAYGKVDSLGQKIGFPIFKNGAEVYETKDINYNFETKKAKISEVVTQQGEGYLHGDKVFKNDQDELFSIDNSYTTCNLEHPHFSIKARRTKAIPGDKIVAGPFNMFINDVWTPLGFPFGMFPAQKESKSGILFPSYGEEQRRGFFLQRGGYFFDISDYVKVALTGDIYSRGGHAVYINTTYRKRYAHNGSFNFSYTRTQLNDQIESPSIQNDYRITWSHTPQSRRNSRFSANVNAATSTFNQNNFLGVGTNNSGRLDNTTAKLSSSVSYNTSFQGTPFTLGLNARFNQDLNTNEVDLLLPEMSLNMQNVYPFRSKGGGTQNWVDQINFRYSMNGTNQITNNLGRIGDATQDSIAPFNVETLPDLLEKARRGFRHSIPVSTSFNVLKYFTVTPSFNYQERWYFERLQWGLDEDGTTAVIIDTLDGFNRVFDYSISAGVATRLYGTKFFKKGKIKAIRHVMNPSVSLSYRPDFGDERFGFYQRLETEDGREIFQSRHQGFVFGEAPRGESGSVGFSVNNTLEMKVASKKDTANNEEKIPILKNFGFSGSYNIVADSFQLSNISWRATTALFQNKLNVNLNGTIDPYVYVLDERTENENGTVTVRQRRIDQFAWNVGNGIGQLTNLTLALNTNFSPQGRKKDNSTQDKIMNSNLNEADKDFFLNNPDAYVDFEIPWNLRINYSLNYSKRGFEEANITQTLRFSGDLSLTEKWKVNFNSGYDLENNDFTQTNIGINRDLHCWQLSFNWVPFGNFQSYTFFIGVKSSLLQDLKLNRQRSFFDL